MSDLKETKSAYTDRKKPKPQEIYRHFKDENKLYQIITTAQNRETGEDMVIYQSMYGDFKIYASPLLRFLSETDAVKGDNVPEEPVFEKTGQEVSIQEVWAEGENTAGEELLRFLDADTYEEKRNLLIHMRAGMTDRLIDDIAASMDVTVEAGDIDERFASLLKCVETLSRYEVTRL